MEICKVIGNVWATKKDENLEGFKLMVVQVEDDLIPSHAVAVDCVGAGSGDTVLVVRGSAARLATGRGRSPVDMAIVGIVDKTVLSE